MEKKTENSDLIALSGLYVINLKEIDGIKNYYEPELKYGSRQCYEVQFKSGNKIDGICKGSLAFSNLDKLISDIYSKQRN